MTFPVVEATNTSVTDPSSTSHTVNLPAGVAAGDILIVFLQTSSTITGPVVFPAGWTGLYSHAGASSAHSAAGWRKATGGESTVVLTTPDNARSTHNSYRISGAADPETDQAPEAAVNTGANPPNVTPTGGAKDYLWLTFNGAITTGNAAPPTNYTDEVSRRGSGSACESARRELNATSENPGAWGTPGTNPVSSTMAVHPGPNAPVVDSISPNTGPDTGQTIITISGSLFVATPTVTIGGTSALSVVFNSATSLTVVTPAGTIGPQDVVVTNPDAQNDTLAGGFIYTGTPSDGVSLNCPAVVRLSSIVAY